MVTAPVVTAAAVAAMLEAALSAAVEEDTAEGAEFGLFPLCA